MKKLVFAFMMLFTVSLFAKNVISPDWILLSIDGNNYLIDDGVKDCLLHIEIDDAGNQTETSYGSGC